MEQSSDARGLDLVFRSISSEDEGEYSCEAVIDGRKEQQFFKLKVIGEYCFSTRASIIAKGTYNNTDICVILYTS